MWWCNAAAAELKENTNVHDLLAAERSLFRHNEYRATVRIRWSYSWGRSFSIDIFPPNWPTSWDAEPWFLSISFYWIDIEIWTARFHGMMAVPHLIGE